jgi:L-asparaginase
MSAEPTRNRGDSTSGGARVFALFTGGTISMRYDPEKGGATSVLNAQDLIDRTQGLSEIAPVDAVDWGRVPASHLSFAQLFDWADRLSAALRNEDCAGAVLVQGTDNIEETSFALDLLIDSSKPVVVVGAMRNAFEDGYEGPVNLRDAVRCAASSRMRDQGVMVVMAGEIHAADDVVKTNTYSYATFKSPNLGPLGFVDDGDVIVRRRRSSRMHVDTDRATEPIPLLKTYLGEDGSLIRMATKSGARGFVIEGAGAGNTPPDMLAAAVDAINAGLPVVMATRCPTGRSKPAYAFPGGGATWRDAGALFAGYLSSLKARLLLSFALGAGMDHASITRLFRDLGTASESDSGSTLNGGRRR